MSIREVTDLAKGPQGPRLFLRVLPALFLLLGLALTHGACLTEGDAHHSGGPAAAVAVDGVPGARQDVPGARQDHHHPGSVPHCDRQAEANRLAPPAVSFLLLIGLWVVWSGAWSGMPRRAPGRVPRRRRRPPRPAPRLALCVLRV